jgi:DUF917 family protein
MLTLTQSDIQNLVIGSSIFSTGGGFQERKQLELFNEFWLQKKVLQIVDIEELNEDDFVCTGYAVGSPASEKTDFSTEFLLAKQEFEKYTGKKFVAVFEGETNIEALAFQAALAMNIPVLDADGTGGRAVPEIQFDNMFVHNLSLLPLVAVADGGKEIAMIINSPAEVAEQIVRDIAVRTGSSVVVLDHAMSVKDAKKYLTCGVMKRSMKIGKMVQDGSDLAELIKAMGATEIIRGKITKNTVSNNPSTGFNEGNYWVSDGQNELKMYVKNENILCWKNDIPYVTCPDLLITLDAKTLKGVANTDLQINQEVIILALPATDLWRSEAGQKNFHPSKFGFDFQTVLLAKNA